MLKNHSPPKKRKQQQQQQQQQPHPHLPKKNTSKWLPSFLKVGPKKHEPIKNLPSQPSPQKPPCGLCQDQVMRTMDLCLTATFFTAPTPRKTKNISWLVGEPTPLKNMLVKLETFPKFRGEHKKYLKPPPSHCFCLWDFECPNCWWFWNPAFTSWVMWVIPLCTRV